MIRVWAMAFAVTGLLCLGADPPGEKGEPTDAIRTPAAPSPQNDPNRRQPINLTLRPAKSANRDDAVTCANLIYAGSKSSVCFSDKFLDRLEKETNIVADRKFKPVKLSSEDMYQFPFAIMTGEGPFSLYEGERKNLKSYLTRGGFLLASAGCSSADWDRSFRREMKAIFPDKEMKKFQLDHSIYHTVFDINDIKLSHGGRTLLEGLEIDGKIVLIYSPEGLNDTSNAGGGCCCCGGNEVRNCQEINVNIITYALTH